MRVNEKKLISYLIVIIPLALVLMASFFITTFYLEKLTNYFNSAKEQSIQEHVNNKKSKSEIWTNQLELLFDYKYNRVEDNILVELNSSVDRAYDSAMFIYNKYKGVKSSKEIKERIVDALSQMRATGDSVEIFIHDFDGNAIVSSKTKKEQKNLAAYKDADHRSIILEQIQIVRKKGEGYITSNYANRNGVEKIKVKNLNIFNWYVGSSIDVDKKYLELQEILLNMVKSIPLDKADFMGIYSDKKGLYLSEKMAGILGTESSTIIPQHLTSESKWDKDQLDGYYYYSQYFKPLDWHIIYGFDISQMSKQELQKQKDLENILDNELQFIMKSSGAIVLLVVIFSLLLSRKINKIFNQYQHEVEERTKELQKLNSSLEHIVYDEVKAHRQKDKMLIQQSKMAEMGDMLSMIAHQWRQPLNQMSYVLMNIDSAYEYKELDKKYLDTKLKEGNALLEFMSTTIDDFRNYFRPDKEKNFVLVSDVIQTSVGFMQNSLDMDSIEIELNVKGRDLTHIYKNEFMQVILNLIKNAKDVLVIKRVEEPKIVVTSTSTKDKLIVEICDNAGGVDEAIMDKIFEPYFSTKDAKSGTGLGLYMSKMIIEEHLNGKLSVTNTQEGACFKIEI